MDVDYFEPVVACLNGTNQSAFITGKAGTGKSTFLRHFVGNTKKRIVVLAPTGLAALNVKGQTIHAFFKFKPELLKPEDLPFSPLRAHLYRAVDTLIIDEVSMVRVDLMNAIDLSLRRHRARNLPFGGVQLVLIGDLFQLPPVTPDQLAEYFDKKFGGPYFFNAPVFASGLRLACFELSRVMRQQNRSFIDLLGRVRTAGQTDEDLIRLHDRHIAVAGPAPDSAVVLTTTNALASRINREALAALPGIEATHEAVLSGSLKDTYDRLLLRHRGNPDQLERALEASFPTSVRLTLKPGARIIMIKNDSQKRWVNGSVGTVLKLGPGEKVTVELESGEAEIDRETWEDVEYLIDRDTDSVTKRVRGCFSQFPLRLAWALTIHKAQGQSLDRVCVDLGGRTFAPGQAYVALSRCRSFEGLYLRSEIQAKDIFVDPRIPDFYRRLSCSQHGTA